MKEKAKALNEFVKLVGNAEYAYSSVNDTHNDANSDIEGEKNWDCFISVAKIGKINVPIIFKIRTIDTDIRSQIYSIVTKNETSYSRGGVQQNNLQDAHPNTCGESPVSGNKLPQKDIGVKMESSSDRYMSDEEFQERYGLKLRAVDEVEDVPVSQTFAEAEAAAKTRERFSVDDDATAMERQLDRLKSPEYQDELARTGGSAALARNQKQIEELEWRIRRDPETYERKKERELQTEGNVAAKVQKPSQRELNREREAWLQEEQNQKAEKQKSKPWMAKKNLRGTVLNLFSIPEGSRAELGAMIDSYADRLIKNGVLTEADRKAECMMPVSAYQQQYDTFFSSIVSGAIDDIVGSDAFALRKDSVWLNRNQMAELFDRDMKNRWQTCEQCDPRGTGRTSGCRKICGNCR